MLTLAYVAYDKLVLDGVLDSGPATVVKSSVEQTASFTDPEPLLEAPVPADEQKSIVVLPFVNIGNPEQEYVADGISEQIITGLARNPDLFVISSNSTFTWCTGTTGN